MKGYTPQFYFSIGKIRKVTNFKKLQKIVGHLYGWVHAPRWLEIIWIKLLQSFVVSCTWKAPIRWRWWPFCPNNPIVLYTCTDYIKMKNFFGTRTWNSMKTLGLLKNIIAMISVQYLACFLRISNALGEKPMHYIIEKSSIHCAPTELWCVPLKHPLLAWIPFIFYHNLC